MNKLYVLLTDVTCGVYLNVRRKDGEAERWHVRYGHIGHDMLRQLSHLKMVSGMSMIDGLHSCDTCIITK
jgi:hypothetical protein